MPAQGLASSKAAEAATIVASSLLRPTMCRPTGSPSDEKPHGMLAAGLPIMLIGKLKG